MDIQLAGHHCEITPALRSYVSEKFERLARHFGRIVQAQVVLTVEKQQQKAEANLHVAGNDLFADAIDADMYAAIDALVDKLDRQLVKHKEKSSDHRNNSV
ncbi:MAG: ribosome-associated translation inhibitor RaiA [Pseudomonadota bacterium]